MIRSLPVLVLFSALFGAATAHPTWKRRAGNPQTSLTLLEDSIVAAFKQDGTNGPGAVAGQTPSITSGNNFINFCLTSKLPHTAGKQVATGSCNQAPMGEIAGKDNMPSVKFQFPRNGDKTSVKPNQPFTVVAKLQNLIAGSFTNAESNYFAGPQKLKDGRIMGHSHIVIEALPSLDSTTPTDPRKFAFFKGVNRALEAGNTFSVHIDKGLPPGFYKLSTINSAANHQPVLVAVAQHGALDDTVYFQVVKGDSDATRVDAAAAASQAVDKKGGDKGSKADSGGIGGKGGKSSNGLGVKADKGTMGGKGRKGNKGGHVDTKS